MDAKAIQRRLVRAGFYTGAIDGAFGAMSWSALFSAAAGRQLGQAKGMLGHDLGSAMATWSPPFGLALGLRAAHFLGQASHETTGFRHMVELWGPTPAQKRYEGRADLGNTVKGDGFLMRGRGIFQVTGRDNYKRLGERIGVDLIAKPERAAEPEIAVRLALEYWSDKRLNAWADKDDTLAVSRGINLGNPRSKNTPNHALQREAATARVRAVLL